MSYITPGMDIFGSVGFMLAPTDEKIANISVNDNDTGYGAKHHITQKISAEKVQKELQQLRQRAIIGDSVRDFGGDTHSAHNEVLATITGSSIKGVYFNCDAKGFDGKASEIEAKLKAIYLQQILGQKYGVNLPIIEYQKDFDYYAEYKYTEDDILSLWQAHIDERMQSSQSLITAGFEYINSALKNVDDYYSDALKQRIQQYFNQKYQAKYLAKVIDLPLLKKSIRGEWAVNPDLCNYHLTIDEPNFNSRLTNEILDALQQKKITVSANSLADLLSLVAQHRLPYHTMAKEFESAIDSIDWTKSFYYSTRLIRHLAKVDKEYALKMSDDFIKKVCQQRSNDYLASNIESLVKEQLLTEASKQKLIDHAGSYGSEELKFSLLPILGETRDPRAYIKLKYQQMQTNNKDDFGRACHTFQELVQLLAKEEVAQCQEIISDAINTIIDNKQNFVTSLWYDYRPYVDLPKALMDTLTKADCAIPQEVKQNFSRLLLDIYGKSSLAQKLSFGFLDSALQDVQYNKDADELFKNLAADIRKVTSNRVYSNCLPYRYLSNMLELASHPYIQQKVKQEIPAHIRVQQDVKLYFTTHIDEAVNQLLDNNQHQALTFLLKNYAELLTPQLYTKLANSSDLVGHLVSTQQDEVLQQLALSQGQRKDALIKKTLADQSLVKTLLEKVLDPLYGTGYALQANYDYQALSQFIKHNAEYFSPNTLRPIVDESGFIEYLINNQDRNTFDILAFNLGQNSVFETPAVVKKLQGNIPLLAKAYLLVDGDIKLESKVQESLLEHYTKTATADDFQSIAHHFSKATHKAIFDITPEQYLKQLLAQEALSANITAILEHAKTLSQQQPKRSQALKIQAFELAYAASQPQLKLTQEVNLEAQQQQATKDIASHNSVWGMIAGVFGKKTKSEQKVIDMKAALKELRNPKPANQEGAAPPTGPHRN